MYIRSAMADDHGKRAAPASLPGVFVWTDGKKRRITAAEDFRLAEAAWRDGAYPPDSLDPLFGLTGADPDPRAGIVVAMCRHGMFPARDMVGHIEAARHPFVSGEFVPDGAPPALPPWYKAELASFWWFWSDDDIDELKAEGNERVGDLMDLLRGLL